ncbi:probable selenium-dependent hydroxylase accessory protein YqeC [Anaerolinea thermolimosa]|uniref:selenium cofactor biosynthesis protein YqeC n=1 Tax=Anaerolinea thermolimosa TaxID=229919 RepID=UPI000A02182B|nr:selenium cofactor biosynthesis protein YqeC [Anaerolinea thermolimosa]GAP05977.1 probable selenium-dependent hydroxylase accessory protein YqeC [Anaerolinea thermolimosa]
MDLALIVEALSLRTKRCIALCGAGGKTSAMFRLGRALSGGVILSNTAHLALAQCSLADRVYFAAQVEDVPAFKHALPDGLTLITGPVGEKERTRGLSGEVFQQVLGLAVQWKVPFLVEADGARGLPLKAPAAWEPPIPEEADVVMVVAGLSGLGKPLTDAWVYRPEDFGRLANLQPGEPIHEAALARVLVHPEGGRKNIPAGAGKLVLLNQRDAFTMGAAELNGLVRRLLGAFDGVVVASLHGAGADGRPAEIVSFHRPVAGVVLAAGAGERLGKPKQLLPWEGVPLVRRAVESALHAGLDPVIVVCGAYSGEVAGALQGLPVKIVRNDRWQDGQGTSVSAGVRELLKEDRCGGAIFLLADQPFVNQDVIQALVHRHATTLEAVIAPRVKGQRTNPVLFDRRTFSDLGALTGKAGGRQVMDRWPPTFVEWEDERLLIDIDTLDDYQKYQPMG